jgi:hypothetical protein
MSDIRSFFKSAEKPSGSVIDEEPRPSTSKQEILPSEANEDVGASSSNSTFNKTVSGVEIKAIVGRWKGPADDGTDSVFFQVHLAGLAKPGKDDNWFHFSELSEISDMVNKYNRIHGIEEASKSSPSDHKSFKVPKAPRGKSRKRPSTRSPSIMARSTPKPKSNAKSRSKAGPKSVKNLSRGFGRGLAAESVLAATKVHDELLYLVKWQGVELADLCLAKDCNLKCPELVIEYFQRHLQIVKKE